jgi:hypothetical protein
MIIKEFVHVKYIFLIKKVKLERKYLLIFIFFNLFYIKECMKTCKSCSVGDKCTACPDGSNRVGEKCDCNDGFF